MEKNDDVRHRSTPEAKIALFRSLFRGREDVYPRRFVSWKTGKAGFAPACSNEWLPGICEKPRIKCAQCAHQRFLPVTDDVVRRHLAGKDDEGREFVMGNYPMLLDETCFFLAVDLDKADWKEHANAVLVICRHLELPAALERLRSGSGGHIWFFFSEAIPATLARKLGSHVLTEAMEQCPDIGLDAYDRFVPNQDTLPHGGFGGAIALPLQKGPRGSGNTVFLDADFLPFLDQWAFLSTIRRSSRLEIEGVVRKAEARGRVVGVRMAAAGDEEDPATSIAPPSRPGAAMPIAGTLPKNLELVLGSEILIEKETLAPAFRNRLIRLAAFQNPEFSRAQAMRLPTYGKPRIVGCARDYPHHVGLPRGCLDEVIQLLENLNVEPTIRDERYPGRPLRAAFHGELRPDQKLAAEAMLAHDIGVLSATTAFGKTVLGAWLIAQRGVNTLVLVHRKQLQEQWIDRLSTFLGMPTRAIGRIGGGRRKPYVRAGGEFAPALSRTSVGLSLDAQVAGLAAGKRVYLFSPHPWTAESVRNAIGQVAK